MLVVNEAYAEDIDSDIMDAINRLFAAYKEDSNNQNEKKDERENNVLDSDLRDESVVIDIGKIDNHHVTKAKTESEDFEDKDYEVRSEDFIEWTNNDIRDVLDFEKDADVRNVVDSGELLQSDEEEVLSF